MKQMRTHRPFTLVELLVVVAIMIIILGISAPAFRNLAMGSAVDVAARMVSSQLMLARSEAISRRQCIAVIMPDNNFTKDPNDISNYSYTAFRSAIVDENAGTYTFREWVPNTSWTFLPTGAVIRYLDNDIPSTISFNNTRYQRNSQTEISSGSNFTTLSDSSNAIYDGQSNSNVRCIIFRRNGKPTQRNVITIMEGLPDHTRENFENCNILETNQYTGLTRFIYTGNYD